MRQRADDRRGTAALAATVATWAMAFPAIRVGLASYSPWALGLLRLSVASVALAGVGVVIRPRRPSGRQWLRVLASGLLGQTLYQGLLMTGETAVPAGTASILIATAPIFSVLIAALLLRERLGRRWQGFALAFAGTTLVGLSLGVGGGPAALLVLAAAVCQGVYHVTVKPLAGQIGALAATMWSLWAGAVIALPALPALVAESATAAPASLAAAVFLGVVPSAAGYLVWSFALARTTVGRSTVVLYLIPPLTMLLAWIGLGERPSMLAVAGGVSTITGVVLARRAPRTPAGDASAAPGSGDGAAGLVAVRREAETRWTAATEEPPDRGIGSRSRLRGGRQTTVVNHAAATNDLAEKRDQPKKTSASA